MTPAQPGEMRTLRDRLIEAMAKVPIASNDGYAEADAALSVVEPELARLRDESAHRWECQQTLERIMQKLREELAAVTKERDAYKVICGKLSNDRFPPKPDHVGEAVYEKTYTIEQVVEMDRQLAATKAKLVRAEYAIDAIMDMSKGTQTSELLAIWRICHAAVWTTPPQADGGEARNG